MRNLFLMMGGILFLFGTVAGAASAKVESGSLVDVGPYHVTVNDLKTAISASPFATQFAGMDEKDQASLRGDLLKRLVISRLLFLEAEKTGLDKSSMFMREVDNFRRGLLYRQYMDRIRARVALSKEELEELRQSAGGNSDTFAAMRAARIAKRYRAVRQVTVESLINARHVVVHRNRINDKTKLDDVLMEGDGLEVTLGDIGTRVKGPQHPNPEWITEQLLKLGELLLVSEAAAAEGVDVSDRVETYRDERLPALLIERKEKEWVPDEVTLQNYFAEHPEIGHVAERRHIGMLVTANYAQAVAMRKRILDGESLFRLAGLYSIDPYGRSHNGDMGWVREGTGIPEIERAVAKLRDNEVSEIIKTGRGYHVVTILERRAGEDRPLAGVRDKVRQAILNEKLDEYVRELEGKYKVTWNLTELSPADMAADRQGDR